MQTHHSQKGFLLISAIILIVIVGFLSLVVAYLVTTESYSSTMRLESKRAFYLARSALEVSSYHLLTTSNLTQRLACEGMTESDLSELSIAPFDSAEYSIETDWHYITSSLPYNVTSSASVIKINSSDIDKYRTFKPRGRVLIDREAIDYQKISTDNTDCDNNPPCLMDVIRGAGGTTSTFHTAGTPVSQNQCFITIEANVPTLTDPIAKRRIIGEVKQLEEGWLVGDVSSGETIVRWNGKDWIRYGPGTIPNVDMHDVSMLSYADVWAVGNVEGSNAFLIHWDGSDWTRYSPSVAKNENLYGVDCVDHLHCHAVGEDGTFLSSIDSFGSWDFGNWKSTAKTSGTDAIPTDVRMNAVSCSSATHCRAVGGVDSSGDGRSVFAHWDDTSQLWVRTEDAATPDDPSEDLLGISCPDDTHCHAVGDNGTFVFWNDSTSNWEEATKDSSLTAQMNGVYCTESDNCWAVGEADYFARWNGSQWSLRSISSLNAAGKTFYAVTCSNADDCWAVGEDKVIVHWNGSDWEDFTPDSSVPTQSLRGIGVIANHTQHHVPWHESFQS